MGGGDKLSLKTYIQKVENILGITWNGKNENEVIVTAHYTRLSLDSLP